MSLKISSPSSGSSRINPPPFKFRPRRPSLSRRIVWTMVLVGFLSAIVGGILYQVQVSDTIRRLDQRNRQEIIDNISLRLHETRLPTQVTERIDAILEQRRTVVSTRPMLETALDRSIWIVLLVAIVASVLAWLLGLLLTRRIVRSLTYLRQASQRVAQGDFSQRIPLGQPDEIGQVAYSFNLMSGRLENAEERRRELLSDVSHELKTPLASIQGHMEALRDGLPRAQANPQAIYDIVLEDVAELDRMVGSLRAWLNTQGLIENLEIGPLDLAVELPALIERFAPRAEAANLKLETGQLDKLRPVLADRNALRHILSNLVDNALRYTLAGGSIRLQAWPGEGESPRPGDPTRITLAVSDTGSGIAPEHWPHLFERFYRVDKSRSRDTGGTGLGLAVVRDLAQAQGGRVWLTSRVGEGTTFFVTLPAAL